MGRVRPFQVTPGVQPVACSVARGDDPTAALASVLADLDADLRGRAVVLTRLAQPTPASAAVVHALVDLLDEGGCSEVVVAGSLSTADRDRGHLSVAGVARTAGLTGRTPRGTVYDVVDLHSSTMPAPVPPSSVLAGEPVSAQWVGAGVRVVLGRSVTEANDGFAGCLTTLLGAAPEVAGADPADVATDLLEHLPPALAVIDALVSSHGPDGARLVRELDTGAVVAGTDALLADSVLAALHGEDRSASRLVARALRRLGEPRGSVVGDLTPFAGWQPAHPLLRAAVRRASTDPAVGRVLAAATGGPDPEADPADPVLAGVRSVLTPLVAAAGEPSGQGALAGLLGALASVGEQSRGWVACLAKDRVDRVVVPLGFDPAAVDDAAYDGLPEFFAPYERVLQGLPSGRDGMRWSLVDGATVFEVSREVAADFEEFVARVDVAAGISLMADYLGGRRVALSTDDAGRVVRQAERNLYLPQPNYLALWGGEPIDVCKVELVQRGADEHRLLWRTVESPNGSATWDDGTLTFTDVGRGRTRVTVRGRQLFALPLAWGAVDLAVLPEVRGPLLEEAYRRFFTTTFDNLEACFEGREFRIGRPALAGAEPLATVTGHLVLRLARDWLADRSSAGSGRATVGSPSPEVDVHGFTHVRGTA